MAGTSLCFAKRYMTLFKAVWYFWDQLKNPNIINVQSQLKDQMVKKCFIREKSMHWKILCTVLIFFPWNDGGGSVFVMKKEFAEKIAKNGQIDLDIEIRCLKEEAKDEDIESGVSECEE